MTIDRIQHHRVSALLPRPGCYCKTASFSAVRTRIMTTDITVIYHNPRCSKSRETLQILEDNHQQPDIIEYLENPPTAQELKRIIAMLGISARELLRNTEPVYQEAELNDDSLSEDDIIEAICRYPALMQRPIVICGNRAVIGRPPVRVLEIIA